MSKLDNIYGRLPVWAQNIAVTGYGAYWHWLRFGGSFSQHTRAFRERERFSTEEWVAWTHEQLKSLLCLSIDTVSYYRQQYSEAQKKAARAGELSALPVLEKDILRASPRSLLRQDISPKETIYHTSGTTGTPIASIWTLEENRKSLALREVRSANWAGVSFSMPRATFSGRLVEQNPESQGPFHRYNAAEKQVYFSAFHLRPATAHIYVQALWKHHIDWLTGYAVSYYLLAQFILEQGIDVPPLKAVITTSEKLTPEMRATIEKAFHCRAFEEYSTVENVLFASECECGNLHVSPDAGVVEIIRPDGSPCAAEEVGEVVATCLLRDYQPLIRFRLGDLASWSAEQCHCGRRMPVIKEVVGRLEEVVTGPDGRKMVRFHGIFVDQPNIIEGQIIQESIDHIHVKIVPTANFSQEDVNNIVARVQARMGASIGVTVETVPSIPRTSAGKFKAVISKING